MKIIPKNVKVEGMVCFDTCHAFFQNILNSLLSSILDFIYEKGQSHLSKKPIFF